MRTLELTGMRAFTVVWIGQVLSLLGSGMTRFALLIWIWDQTHQALAITLVGFFIYVPELLATFFAGPLVDRWNRKRVIIAGDLGAGIATVVMLILLVNGRLAVEYIYVAGAIAGASGAFHGLAFVASISVLIPKEHYARAAGMDSLAEYAAIVGAPIAAGALIGLVGLEGIMLIDIFTFLVAVSLIAMIHFPQADQSPDDDSAPPNIWREAAFGFRYIFSRNGLLGLALMAFAFNLLEGMSFPLIPPMILARTGENEFLLGFVQSISGVGGVIGGLAMSYWGGPQRKFRAIVIGSVLTGILGDMVLGIGRGIIVWAMAAICVEIFIPLIIASNQAIWQAKVPPALQGRVFAARRLISGVSGVFALIIGGVLADKIFEPAMMPGGALADSFGWLVGTGAGAGMGLLLVIFGALSGLSAIVGYAFHDVRNVEALLPDHDNIPETLTQNS